MADEEIVRLPRAEVPSTSPTGELSDIQKVEQGAGQLLHELHSKVDALFHSGKMHLAQDVEAEWTKIRADVLAKVTADTPAVEAVLTAALADAEKALLAVIESHLA